MERPRVMREERRNGINAVIFFDRFAVPSLFLGVVMIILAVAAAVLMILSKPLGMFWMAIPGLVWVGLVILYWIARVIWHIVGQFIEVNRKDLGNG